MSDDVRLCLPSPIREATLQPACWYGMDPGCTYRVIRGPEDFVLSHDGLINDEFRLSLVGLRLLCRLLPGRLYSYFVSLGVTHAAAPSLHRTAVAVLRAALSEEFGCLPGRRIVQRPNAGVITGFCRRTVPFQLIQTAELVAAYTNRWRLSLLAAASSDNSFYLQFEDAAKRTRVNGVNVTPVLVVSTSGQLGSRLGVAVGVALASGGLGALKPLDGVSGFGYGPRAIEKTLHKLLVQVDDCWRQELQQIFDRVQRSLISDIVVPRPRRTKASYRAYQAGPLQPFKLPGHLGASPTQLPGDELLRVGLLWVHRQTDVQRRLVAASHVLSWLIGPAP